MLKVRVWLYVSLLLSSGATASNVSISPTANGMAEAYATHYGKPGDALQVAICGRDDRKRITKNDTELFALAGASGRLGMCGGGAMSPFTYAYTDKNTGIETKKIIIATTEHQFQACLNKYKKKFDLQSESEIVDAVEKNILFQPNGHFKEYSDENNKDWRIGFNLKIVRDSINYFKNKKTDLVLFELSDENSFTNNLLPDGSIRRKIPPIITHLDRRKLSEYFKYNKSIVIGTSMDLKGPVGARYSEIGGAGRTDTREVSEMLDKPVGLIATNHTAFYGLSGSPIYLSNKHEEIGLLGVIKSTGINEYDKEDNPIVSKDCHLPEHSKVRATKVVPYDVIIDFLKIEYGETIAPSIDFSFAGQD